MKRRFKMIWVWIKFVWWMMLFIAYILVAGIPLVIAHFLPRGKLPWQKK